MPPNLCSVIDVIHSLQKNHWHHSYFNPPAPHSHQSSTKGHTLHMGEDMKLAAHNAACTAVGVDFIPVVAETLGAWSDLAVHSICRIGCPCNLYPHGCLYYEILSPSCFPKIGQWMSTPPCRLHSEWDDISEGGVWTRRTLVLYLVFRTKAYLTFWCGWSWMYRVSMLKCYMWRWKHWSLYVWNLFARPSVIWPVLQWFKGYSTSDGVCAGDSWLIAGYRGELADPSTSEEKQRTAHSTSDGVCAGDSWIIAGYRGELAGPSTNVEKQSWAAYSTSDGVCAGDSWLW